MVVYGIQVKGLLGGGGGGGLNSHLIRTHLHLLIRTYVSPH